jgi:hypothetical protein
LFPFSVLWGLSSEVFIRGFISSLPQRAWDKKALLLLLLLLLSALTRKKPEHNPSGPQGNLWMETYIYYYIVL